MYHYLPVAERITRDVFFAIWRFILFCNNESPPTDTSPSFAQLSSLPDSQPVDRLCKVWPVISAIVAGCLTNYRRHREQAIDQAMVAFKGRSSMKQYLLMKPVKRGFKIWVQAATYVCELECYTGKRGNTTEVGLGGSVVTRLTREEKHIICLWTVFFLLFYYNRI